MMTDLPPPKVRDRRRRSCRTWLATASGVVDRRLLVVVAPHPAAAGRCPLAVEWMAMKALRPAASLQKACTDSWPSKAGESKTLMETRRPFGQEGALYAAPPPPTTGGWGAALLPVSIEHNLNRHPGRRVAERPGDPGPRTTFTISATAVRPVAWVPALRCPRMPGVSCGRDDGWTAPERHRVCQAGRVLDPAEETVPPCKLSDLGSTWLRAFPGSRG